MLDGGEVPPKRRLVFTELHDVLSQKIVVTVTFQRFRFQHLQLQQQWNVTAHLLTCRCVATTPRGCVTGVVQLLGSWDNKKWSWVPRDSEPRMTVLARTRSNLSIPRPHKRVKLDAFWIASLFGRLTHRMGGWVGLRAGLDVTTTGTDPWSCGPKPVTSYTELFRFILGVKHLCFSLNEHGVVKVWSTIYWLE
jgi:hypothetical protein